MQPPELDVNGAVLRWVVASTTIKCKKQPCINLPTLCFCVIMLECTKGHVKIAKSKAKHSLKETINKIEDSTINHLKVAVVCCGRRQHDQGELRCLAGKVVLGPCLHHACAT